MHVWALGLSCETLAAWPKSKLAEVEVGRSQPRTNHTPRVLFALDSHKFLKNVRCCSRTIGDDSGAPAPSLRFSQGRTVAMEVAVAGITPTVIEAIRMGRMTVLRKARRRDHRWRPQRHTTRSLNSSSQRVCGPPHSMVVRVEPTFHRDVHLLLDGLYTLWRRGSSARPHVPRVAVDVQLGRC